ncbi:FAD-binding protein [Sulfitobacter donghicola]|uniref:2-hydroxy-acid oxidase n=1 Tax=Sulfitobacter donghicola DSW-25 = KCTC 12864 = JCM 14565 TaxID=1300350 RepID=A0A073IMT1_9RHOB|nr:FAD-binding protein [Sulfitobacter donghicola]KEJ90806.1 2-hydroxy-acid oxidase [Sulfitobacter donghicola DSW-25 = KCTC 12864 = JCM 14565]KIN68080.1 Glycolate oxidase, subunit GlcE [Sulfitobacter donghicola DSW-25 = KCTC 12864 = JCM 14565]
MAKDVLNIPSTEGELAELIAAATDPFAIRGGGTRNVSVEGIGLSTSALNGITLYEPGAMTVVAQAGTPVADIEQALDAENQRLAFEPMDHRGLLSTTGEPTIGGVMAANVSGPRRISVGAARDFLLGVRYVDGLGRVIKNGGRVMKNVTGYDLVKLMAGSYGTLGVLSEVSLKVLPKPETQATLVLHGLEDVAAINALAKALGSPFEVSAAAHDPAEKQTMLRLEGFEASVNYRIQSLQALLGGETSVDETCAERWKAWRDVTGFAEEGDDVWRVSCKPSDGPLLAAKSGALGVRYDWAGGLIWLRTTAGYDLRKALGSYDGHATLVRGNGQAMFEPETAGVARLSAGLRARFDPRGLFNKGLMG